MSFAFNTSTREVMEQVIRDPRFRALTTIPTVALAEIGLIVVAFALFGLSTYAYLHGSLPWLATVALSSFAIYVSFTPLHDATHRTTSGNRRLNDFLGTVSCVLLLPGVTTRIYRYLHLEHHRHTGHSQRDPDEIFVSAPAWALPFVLVAPDLVWVRWYLARWQERPRGERRTFVASIGFYVLFHVVWLASPYWREFLLLWVIPQRLGLFYVTWFFAHIQHPRHVLWEQAPFQTTVRLVANPLARWLMLGQAKHCVHHLAPSVPFYRYYRAWNLGRRLFEAQNIPTRTLFAPSRNLQLPARQPAAVEWLDARVAYIIEVAPGVRAYDLQSADGAVWPPFTAGSHIDVEIAPGLVRQYSLCNAPAGSDRYRIAVKREAEGRGGSRALHKQVKPGDRLRISAPRNHFPLDESFAHHVLVAGGIGITPLLSMAHALHAAGKPFTLHVCARNSRLLAFRDELSDALFADRVVRHLDDGDIAQRFDASTALDPWRAGNALYVCGPAGFMSAVMTGARANGWPGDAMFSESFVPRPRGTVENRPFEVELARSGRVLKVAAEQTLMDVLQANGCAVPCSCTQGICGSCLTPVLSGVPDHRDAILTDAERARNQQLCVCVSRAVTPRLVLDL